MIIHSSERYALFLLRIFFIHSSLSPKFMKYPLLYTIINGITMKIIPLIIRVTTILGVSSSNAVILLSDKYLSHLLYLK